MKLQLLTALFVTAAVSLSTTAQRIAVLSDTHVTPGNANEKQLQRAVAEINADKSFDLVVVDGDLTNEGSDAELANIKSILDGITNHKLLVLPGNHETNWSQSATKTFVDLWGNDRFVYTVDSLVVVGINCGPYMKMGDGHIKQEDLHWLRATLDSAVTNGYRVLSFNHYPLSNDLDNCDDYAGVLADYPVIGHINGHYHSWQKYDRNGIDGASIRALQMGSGDKVNHGYTIVDIDRDWVHIYNKIIGKKAKPKFAWAIRTRHTPVATNDTARFAAPEGFTVEKVWADSASIFTRLGFDNQKIYFGNSIGQARAIERTDGKLAYSIPTGASLFSRPVALQKGRVAFPTATGIIIVDAKGKIVADMPSKEGPYVADGVATPKEWIQGGYKRIESRNPANGKIKWVYDSIFNYCQAAPVVDGNDVVFGAWDTNLRCLDRRTGKLRWVWNNGKRANMLGPGNVVPVVTADRVFIVAPDRYMTAIDRATGKTLWRNNAHKYRESMGHSADFTRVYAKTMDGELVAVDATTPEFKELWTVDMGIGYEHAPCIVAEKDGVVYAGSRRGIVTAVDPIARKVLWNLPLGVSEINGIDIDPVTGDVFVSLIEGTIFRIHKN